MLENAISDLIRKQRPYFILQGNPIKGIGDRQGRTSGERI